MIYYCYRDTENWSQKDFRIKKKFWQEKHRPNHIKKFKHCMDLWNSTQILDWFEYRQELKEISRLSFLNAGIPEISFENLFDLKNDDWLIPIDDDDWVNPKFKDRIKNVEKDFFYSNVVLCDIKNGNLHKLPHDDSCFTTCGYGLRIRMLKKFCLKEIGDLIRVHERVKNLLVAKNISYDFVDDYLSCYLKHFGNATFMWNEFNLKIIKKPIVFKIPKKYGGYAKWCKPYLDKISVLGSKFMIKLL